MAVMALSAVCLQLLDATVLQRLIAGDLAGARGAAGVELPAEFLAETWLWTLRLGQLIGEPGCAPWLVRAVVVADGEAAGTVVGHAGFHGPPDPRGMVEVGYRITPEHRRRGHARAALGELLAYARRQGATIVRASISPDNAASLALAGSYDFTQIGEQHDEIDGVELVFERQI
jgi:[ribosomal protein S5]-alanine N-acetyltransferase